MKLKASNAMVALPTMELETRFTQKMHPNHLHTQCMYSAS